MKPVSNIDVTVMGFTCVEKEMRLSLDFKTWLRLLRYLNEVSS